MHLSSRLDRVGDVVSFAPSEVAIPTKARSIWLCLTDTPWCSRSAGCCGGEWRQPSGTAIDAKLSFPNRPIKSREVTQGLVFMRVAREKICVCLSIGRQTLMSIVSKSNPRCGNVCEGVR